jgi:hypothetical protein
MCLPYKTLNFLCSEGWVHTKISTSSSPMHCTVSLWPGGGRYLPTSWRFYKWESLCRYWRGVEWVRKQDFWFWGNKKPLSLPGNEPRHRYSALHSSRLHFPSHRSAAVLVLPVFQTLVQLRYIRCFSALRRTEQAPHRTAERYCQCPPTARAPSPAAAHPTYADETSRAITFLTSL